MSERGIHYVAADLDESWTFDWVGVGIVELEAYLEKHAAFSAFLDTRCSTGSAEEPAAVAPAKARPRKVAPVAAPVTARRVESPERDPGHLLSLEVGRLLAV